MLCTATFWREDGKRRFCSRLQQNTGAPNEKNRENASNVVFCFLISFYGLLKGYFCELPLFDLFGCGS